MQLANSHGLTCALHRLLQVLYLTYSNDPYIMVSDHATYSNGTIEADVLGWKAGWEFNT